MLRELNTLLIFSKLEVLNHLIYHYHMHNLYAIFAKFLDICKQRAGNLVNEQGNMPRSGVVYPNHREDERNDNPTIY